jgi:predicted Rossmann-fold nucleotide-binding protein
MSDQKQTSIRSIVVFCGSNFGVSPVYADAARALGTEMGRRGLKLIYGGTNKGLMGVLAESAMEADAKVEGVITHRLFERGHLASGISGHEVVNDMRVLSH